jgi:hypothetical protein
LADADEDSNHNHRVDHGETNPYDRDTDGDGTDDGTERRTGTDPAHNGLLDFPEPMVFDMVRGLGAEQGEVEVNTLVLVPTSPVAAWWAPEIEAAVVDNFALEFEVGLRNIDLEALKFAFQGTVAMKEGGKTGHGLQGLVEYLIDEEAFVSTALYILGARLAPAVTLVTLVGPALESHVNGKTYGGFFLNFTLGWAPHPQVVVGTEQNVEWFPNAYLIRWMPQIHWQVCARFQLQAGVGLRHTPQKPPPLTSEHDAESEIGHEVEDENEDLVLREILKVSARQVHFFETEHASMDLRNRGAHGRQHE